jgi:hypothetical protein
VAGGLAASGDCGRSRRSSGEELAEMEEGVNGRAGGGEGSVVGWSGARGKAEGVPGPGTGIWVKGRGVMGHGWGALARERGSEVSTV